MHAEKYYFTIQNGPTLREGLFIKKNKDRWEKVQQGEAPDADEMAKDFVQLVDDLAYAKTFYPTSKITGFVNSLASRIYLRIYQNRREDSNLIVRFWKLDLPLTIARHYRILLFCAFIFLLFYMLGFISARFDQQFTREVLGDSYVDMTERNIANGNPFGVYQSGNAFISWLGLMVWNILVAMLAFVKGIVFGIFSLSALVENAMMVGVFHQMFAAHGLGVEFIFAVMLHGMLELTAIVIACGAGVVMGTSYLFPGTISRMAAFKNGVKDGVKIVVGLIPVFCVAAFFEGFITGLYKMHIVINLLLLAMLGGFILWYFIVYPYRLKKRTAMQTPVATHA
ncbi:MAG TPA: stage II sporulation protein M [Flavisolibacter sp.]|nr:stage II sporulation protein M [Flavisolibacter sp.]